MICFPNCKINLGLRVISKRTDGFHDLDTVFYPVHDVCDVLEVQEAKEFSITQQGIVVDGDVTQNIVYKAWHLLRQKYAIPAVVTYMHKAIPHGAGLGGGSADGSFMLRLLNDYFKLGLNRQTLLALALELGSDCPFFIDNVPQDASGRGEILQSIELSLAGKYLALVKPAVHISTAKAFAGISPKVPVLTCAEILQRPIEQWKHYLYNDFEETIFPLESQFVRIKKYMYDAGALYASMSGTGSTIYGIFDNEPKMQVANDNWCKVVVLQ
jgi:4-diphosphocytidyl-2-C-methyl-D-erythritol kinase